MICFRPGSNRGPSACQADVITTTPRKLLKNTLKIKSMNSLKIISLKEYCWPDVCRTFQIFLNGLCSKPWTFSCANFYLCDASIKCPLLPVPEFPRIFFVPKMPLDEIAVVIKPSSCEHLLLPENNISFHEKMFCAET